MDRSSEIEHYIHGTQPERATVLLNSIDPGLFVREHWISGIEYVSDLAEVKVGL